VTSVGLSVAPDDAEWIWFVAAPVIVSEAAGEIKSYSNYKRHMQPVKCDCMRLVLFRTQCDFSLDFMLW